MCTEKLQQSFKTIQGCRKLQEGGVALAPPLHQFLAEQSTLSKPEGLIMPTTTPRAPCPPPDCQTLRRPCNTFQFDLIIENFRLTLFKVLLSVYWGNFYALHLDGRLRLVQNNSRLMLKQVNATIFIQCIAFNCDLKFRIGVETCLIFL